MTSKNLQVVNFDEMAMTPEVIQNQVNVIQKVMKQVMKTGEHYGTVPGCGDKPTLLKPGAEKLGTSFRLAPSYSITCKELTGGHREYEIVCTLTHIPTSMKIGEGVGLCSSMESKYRWRAKEIKCPRCQKESVIKGKEQYGGGWLCWAKKGGCGAKFKDGDQSIEKQETGRMENPDIADTFNTVLKMAKKRAHVDAILTATAASDIFTQDIEDLPTETIVNPTQPKQEAPGKVQKTHTTTPPVQKPPDNEPPPPVNEPDTPAPTIQEMRSMFSDGFTADPIFVPWLVSKKWLDEGQGIGDLTDEQVLRLYNNYEPIQRLFKEAKKNG